MPTRTLMRPQPSTDVGSVARAFSSRHFLKLVEDTGTIGFWSADLRAERIDASPGLYRILGLDPALPVTFASGLDMIHPDDQAEHSDQIAVLRNGQPIKREFRIVRPDRTQRWVLHHAEVILGPDGRPMQGMGVMFDVTAQHEAMSALRQRHDRLSALLTATGAILWGTQPNGEPAEMSQWMALTGQSFAEIQGFGWTNAIHPEDRPRTHAAWMTAVEHMAAYNTEYRVLCKDGIYRWFNARGIPIMNRDGSVREWIGVCLSVPGRSRYGAPMPETPRPEASPLADAPDPAAEVLIASQIRAGRAISGLSKDDLAQRAKVSVSTVNRLEDPDSTVRARHDTLLAVRRALEEAGVEFTFERGRKPGVREA